MKFASKRDWWFSLILVAVPLFAFVMLSMDFNLTAMVVLSLAAGMIFWLWFGTYYLFRDDHLQVASGPFCIRIYYSEVKSVRSTDNPLSAPALSLKRLEIRHNQGMGFTLVSPVKPEEFVRELEKRVGRKLYKH